jgi:hypothetical protein
LSRSHGLFGHTRQQRIGRSEQPDLLVHLEQRGERGAPVPLVGEEAGIVDGHPRLAAQGRHHLDLFFGNRMRLPPVDAQPAVGLALDEDGNREHAMISLALDDEARIGG